MYDSGKQCTTSEISATQHSDMTAKRLPTLHAPASSPAESASADDGAVSGLCDTSPLSTMLSDRVCAACVEPTAVGATTDGDTASAAALGGGATDVDTVASPPSGRVVGIVLVDVDVVVDVAHDGSQCVSVAMNVRRLRTSTQHTGTVRTTRCAFHVHPRAPICSSDAHCAVKWCRVRTTPSVNAYTSSRVQNNTSRTTRI